MATTGEVRFHEVQRVPHRRWWALAALLTGPAAPVIWLLLLTLSLTTEVRPDGVYYRYRPFHRGFHRIAVGDITSAEAQSRTFWRYFREFTGWGIRLSLRGRGWAFTVWGNRGVAITTTDGRRRFLGSQRPDELQAAIDAAREAA